MTKQLLEEAIECIEGLVDQQAMPDDFWKEPLSRLKLALKDTWSPETPKEDGWYWIKYREGRGMRKVPCSVVHVGKEVLVTTARNLTFFEGPRHGGKGLKCIECNKVKRDKTIRFSPMIPIPE